MEPSQELLWCALPLYCGRRLSKPSASDRYTKKTDCAVYTLGSGSIRYEIPYVKLLALSRTRLNLRCLSSVQAYTSLLTILSDTCWILQDSLACKAGWPRSFAAVPAAYCLGSSSIPSIWSKPGYREMHCLASRTARVRWSSSIGCGQKGWPDCIVV